MISTVLAGGYGGNLVDSKDQAASVGLLYFTIRTLWENSFCFHFFQFFSGREVQVACQSLAADTSFDVAVAGLAPRGPSACCNWWCRRMVWEQPRVANKSRDCKAIRTRYTLFCSVLIV